LFIGLTNLLLLMQKTGRYNKMLFWSLIIRFQMCLVVELPTMHE
jgi:hypothetical protein